MNNNTNESRLRTGYLIDFSLARQRFTDSNSFAVVRGPSKRATIIGRYLVRRSAGLPSEKHGRPNGGGRQTGRDVCHVRNDVHVESGFENGPAAEKTIHKICLPFFFVRVFSE